MTNDLEVGDKSPPELKSADDLTAILLESDFPRPELTSILRTFLTRQMLSRLLMLDELYRLIVDVPGSVVQCGVRWGGDLVAFANLRGIHEPYNYSRRILGFDTFEGLFGVTDKDRKDLGINDKRFLVIDDYAKLLVRILRHHESNAPIGHIEKTSVHTGDAAKMIPAFLKGNPGEIIALLYLDMDIYAPTVAVLKACWDRIPRGGVVVFDELTHSAYPGEAIALLEHLGLGRGQLRRSRYGSVSGYLVKD